MPRFAYTAIDAHGAEKSGLLDGFDVRQVAAILKRQGLFPTEVAVAGVKPGSKPAVPESAVLKAAATETKVSVKSAEKKPHLRLPYTSIVRPKELAVFTRQLATLLKAGMPLVRGLEVLACQERPRARCSSALTASTQRSGRRCIQLSRRSTGGAR